MREISHSQYRVLSCKTNPHRYFKITSLLLKAYIDGASRGNPGHSGIGILITDFEDKPSLEIKQYLGTATNNQAEYAALLRLLREIISQYGQNSALRHLTVYSDSELMVKQLNGEYKVKSKNILKYHIEARSLLHNIKAKVNFVKIPREENKTADKLANQAIDEYMKSHLDSSA